MGTLFVLIGGLIGAWSGLKKSFTACWIFLVNLSFAIYCSIFLAPLLVSYLEIPGLADGYKNVIAVSSIFIVVGLVLQQITHQIINKAETDLKLTLLAARFFSMVAGFLSGTIIVGILLFCLIETSPPLHDFPQKKEIRATACQTLMEVVYTLNSLSFQSLTPEAKTDLQSISLLPKRVTDFSANNDQTETDGAENKPANKSAKKNRSARNQKSKAD